MYAFYMECERTLFKVIIGLYERGNADLNLITNGQFIDNLYDINDKELRSELDKLRQFPLKIQQTIGAAVEVRILKYKSENDL